MRFNNRARLDARQVRDVRGRGGVRSSARLPMRGGLPVGGGIGGLVVVLLVGFLLTQLSGSPGGTAVEPTDLVTQCQTGEDANADVDCARVAVINSVQSYWAQTLPEQGGRPYEPADTQFFSGATTTACGAATSAVGPFYCPADDMVYLDTTFFDDMLEDRLGARGGPFSEAYVIAHEYGHHVQDLLGTTDRVRSDEGATSDSVRLELQADCYAGMWTSAATSATDLTGDVAIISELTPDDIFRAIDAAEAVGDDRIQQRSGVRVDSETWTHGSADQRERWFLTGYEAGDMRACDTFSASSL